MTQIEVKDLELRVDTSNDQLLELHGYISSNASSAVLRKNGKAWREIIPQGVFARAIERAKSQKGIDLLFNHDKRQILSTTQNGSLSVEEDEVGLYFSTKISKTSWGKDLYELVKDGIIKGLSFGMIVKEDTWQMSRDGIALRTILDIDLFEISAVQRPAYPQSLLELRDIEVVQVDVPEGLEERQLNGAENMDKDEIMDLFRKIYDGMSLIAEKVDALEARMNKQDESRLADELEGAKEVLIEAKALAKAQAELTNANVNASQEEEEKSKKVIATTAATPNSETPKPKVDENMAEKRDEDLGEDVIHEEVETQPANVTPNPSLQPEVVEAKEQVKTPEEAIEESDEELANALEKSEETLEKLKEDNPEKDESEKDEAKEDELADDEQSEEVEEVNEETRALIDEYKDFIKSLEVK